MDTPREDLEKEVRIVALGKKTVKFLPPDEDSDEVEIDILPLNFEALDAASKSIAKLFHEALKIGLIADSMRDPKNLVKEIDKVFTPKLFLQLGDNAKVVIQDLITHGTSAQWDEIKTFQFMVGLRLALEVLKHNLGKE